VLVEGRSIDDFVHAPRHLIRQFPDVKILGPANTSHGTLLAHVLCQGSVDENPRNVWVDRLKYAESAGCGEEKYGETAIGFSVQGAWFWFNVQRSWFGPPRTLNP